MAEQIKVNMGELKAAKGDVNLIAYGVGSCVIVVCYDAYEEIAGMLHAILPEKPKKNVEKNKYIDTGIDNLVKLLIKHKVSINNMKAKIYGGARMFDTKDGAETIGGRNIQKAKEILAKKGIKIAGDDTGSDYGRTIYFNVKKKQAEVRSFQKGTIIV